jgi:membrane-bound inhibitor of C-type lysozyme
MNNAMIALMGALGVVAAAGGLSSGCSVSPAEEATPAPDASSGPAGPDAGGPRSPPAQGGASGTVDSVSTPSFTMTTAAGQTVTVNEASSTTYQDGTNPITANAITTGANVLVLGTVSNTTITASQVILQPDDGGGSAASTAAGVIPFQQGAPSEPKEVGQIPADYNEGAGTIVSGTEADQATEASLVAYPGVLVNRTAKLGSGAFNVHSIGVNWPHHIFVDQDFNVVGAN